MKNKKKKSFFNEAKLAGCSRKRTSSPDSPTQNIYGPTDLIAIVFLGPGTSMSDFTIPHLHASEGFTRAYTRLWIELREALDVFHWNIGVLIIQTQSAGVDYVPEYFMNVMGFFLMSNPETIELGCNWHEFRLTTRRKIPTFEACRCWPQYITDIKKENQTNTGLILLIMTQ